MSLRQTLSDVIKPAVDLIYPPRCPLCGTAIAEQNGLCAECWSTLVIPGSPKCSKCQRPFPAEYPNEGGECAPCLADPPRHDGIAAGTLYNDTARKLALSFKHGRRIALSRLLGPLMVAQLPDLEGEWLVIPVPLHWTRLWHRGFNQAGLLAQHIARATQQRVVIDGLHRKKRTRSLGRLSRKAREQMLKGAIHVRGRKYPIMKGAQIILVDDVLTSGATSDACVKALKKAGAKRVVISCFSRVLNEARDQSHLRPQTETPEA